MVVWSQREIGKGDRKPEVGEASLIFGCLHGKGIWDRREADAFVPHRPRVKICPIVRSQCIMCSDGTLSKEVKV
jgi:hypothetical protein